jgi:hypothetical protein
VSKSELSPTGKKKIFVSRPANANWRGGWHGKYIAIMWHSFLFPQGKARPYSRKAAFQSALARAGLGMIRKPRFSFTRAARSSRSNVIVAQAASCQRRVLHQAQRL